MSNIDWDKVGNFFPGEWPSEVLDKIEPELVYKLDRFRDWLGRPIYPSPLTAAWARESGNKTSRHYAVGRLSDAGDIFPDANIGDAFLIATHYMDFGGVGVYFDTEFKDISWPMMHVDLRKKPEIWARVDGKYYYPLRGGEDRRMFWKHLHNFSLER